MKPYSELETLEECQRQMLQVARGILDGRIGIVAGARELTQLLFPLDLSDDPDALTLREIESETGHLPVGDARRHWNAEALKVKDDELHRYQAQVQQRAFRACEALILKCQHADYSGQPVPHVDGVGVAIAVEDGALTILRVLPGSPAAKAGLAIGQVIRQINGVAVKPSDPSTWKGKLRGEAGTKVRVVLADTPQSEPRNVELTRARVA